MSTLDIKTVMRCFIITDTLATMPQKTKQNNKTKPRQDDFGASRHIKCKVK